MQQRGCGWWWGLLHVPEFSWEPQCRGKGKLDPPDKQGQSLTEEIRTERLTQKQLCITTYSTGTKVAKHRAASKENL